MTNPRYLTKSRFKLAAECGTKLFYTKKKEYRDKKLEDPFLAALADGGFQVGELAKCYFKDGHDITTLDYDNALDETNTFLKEENVTLFEPAIRFKNLFIRVDVLKKKGRNVELLEVKAKSFDKEGDKPILNKNGTISASWKPYLLDIAFQTYVVRNAFPKWLVVPYLYLVDKQQPAATSGLNQKFKLKRIEGRKGVEVCSSLDAKDLATKLLIRVPVNSYVELLFNEEKERIQPEKTLEESIHYFSKMYEDDEKIPPVLGAKCTKCEFQASLEEREAGGLSGIRTCFKEALGYNESDLDKETILSIWDFRRKDKLFEAGVVKLDDVTEDDIGPKEDKRPGLSHSERQWLQVTKAKESDLTPYIDEGGLRAELKRLTYPLHFVDFETTTVPIPFNKGRKPYEGIAFQFSHHVVEEDGSVRHDSEYINTEKGYYPNYDFIRALKKSLSKDSGSIFRYSSHENTYLNHIYFQMKDDDSVADKEELSAFIKEISKSKDKSIEKWKGPRSMIDLCEWVKRYYYDPHTEGSNSLKQVFPAVLNSSHYLKEKYSKPIYGRGLTIPGTNFGSMAWVVKEDGEVVDPYSLLPKMFSDASERDLEILLSDDDEINHGGAALTAYAKLQFTEISDYEVSELRSALLKYCELDTLAMVMVFEALREWVG